MGSIRKQFTTNNSHSNKNKKEINKYLIYYLKIFTEYYFNFIINISINTNYSKESLLRTESHVGLSRASPAQQSVIKDEYPFIFIKDYFCISLLSLLNCTFTYM